MKRLHIILIIFCSLAIVSCKKEDMQSDKTEILSFTISEQTNTISIDTIAHTITISVSANTHLNKIVPTIKISDKATIKPASGDTVDFSKGPVKFEVTAEDNSMQEWIVTIKYFGKKEIISFAINKQTNIVRIDSIEHTITISVSENTTLNKIVPTIKISDKAIIKPASGDTVDFSKGPVKFEVTAEDNSVQEWFVTINLFVNNIRLNLDNLSITSFAFDNANTLWIGTDSGLFKVVATGFELFDINTNAKITALAFEPLNKILWVGTTEGLSKLSLNTNAIETILSDNLSNNFINSVYIDASTFKWFGTEKGFTLNNKESWQKTNFKKNASGTITPLDFEGTGVNSIASWDGDFYFATNGRQLWRTTNWNSDIDAFTGASMWDNPYNGFAISDTMYVVFIDSKGQQWMGGREGLQVHVGHDPKQENTPFYDELVSPLVHCVAEASDGKIWAGTENGISIFDGSNWVASDISLPSNFVNAIAFDKSGKIYIGTKKGLVIK